jgi:hypothetical protein
VVLEPDPPEGSLVAFDPAHLLVSSHARYKSLHQSRRTFAATGGGGGTAMQKLRIVILRFGTW